VYGYDYDAGIITVDEARLRKGLPALPNGEGKVSVLQWKAQQMRSSGLPAGAAP